MFSRNASNGAAMRQTLLGIFMGLSLMAVAGNAPAQQAKAPGQALTIERIWGDPALSGPAPRALRFAPDGRSVTFLLPKEENANVLDLWSSDLRGGASKLLVDGAKLGGDSAIMSEEEKARRERRRIFDSGVIEYSWDGAGTAILTPVGGDLYLTRYASGQTTRLTQSEGDEIDAKLSPRGNFASYTRGQNLYLAQTKNGQEIAITKDGAGTLSYGVAEFIAQEELDRFTGTFWSPDEAHLAYARVEERGVPLITRADIGADGRTNTILQRYPATGDPNAIVDLFVLDVATKASVGVDLGANPDYYVARVNWAKDGKALYVQRLARDQKRLDILKVDPATGASAILFSETDADWINLNHDFTPLADGGFLWTSERSGFSHIYRYGGDGRLVRQITRGAWPVRAIEGVDEKRGLVYFTASPDDPLQQHVIAVSYKAPGNWRRITTQEGFWNAEFNADASAFVGSFSDPVTPPQTALYDANGQRLRWIEENKVQPGHAWADFAARYPAPEFAAITSSKQQKLFTRVLKPVGFDPAKRYPAILFVYGGPHRQVVEKSWNSVSMVMRLMQERGYVVFSIDNRGTPNRGRDFERAIAGELGRLEVQEQLEGIAWLKQQSFVDPARVGVWGWSYGGFMTLALSLRAPDAFAAAASFAPVTDWRLYDTGYTERYMGNPKGNPKGYGDSDLTKEAAALRTPLLLVHGLADDNVIFANSAAMMAALQSAGKPFETMVYPGQKHGIASKASRLHWTRTLLDFFDGKLQGAESPERP